VAQRKYTATTQRRLYTKAGDCCAYPDCPERLLIKEGYLADICHIEALNPEGPRYNSAPEITDEQRNSEPNLILLCKNHHYIIDRKNENGDPYYSTEQLKAMKRAHEELVESARNKITQAKQPSILARIVRELSTTRYDSTSGKVTLPFTIDEKISFNDVQRYRGIIEKYAPYAQVYLEKLYNELEANQLETVLSVLNDLYLMSKRSGQSADDTLDLVQDRLIERLSREGALEYSEDLEMCSRIVIVDGFMRCKILEEPIS
jgi:hypothetical protein